MKKQLSALISLTAVLIAGFFYIGQNSSMTQAQGIALPDGDKILAWVANATEPGNQGASQPGSLVFFNSDGTQEVLLELPQGTSRVMACGDNATSPDGSLLALFVGQDSGTLYVQRDQELELVTVANGVNAMACTGNGTFQFAPDGSRYAYLDYSADFANSLSPVGRLQVHESAGHSRTGSFENVAAFDLRDDTIASVSFFNNNNSEAVEVAISLWDGSSSREVATLFSDEENRCFYNSASTQVMDSDKLAVVLGYRCNLGPQRDSQWQFYVVDTTARSATLLSSDMAGGRFFPFTRTNQVFSSPDGETVFFTVPDGISNRSVSLKATEITEAALRDVVNRDLQMGTLSDPPYTSGNHAPLLSPDRRWLASVGNDANQNARLIVVDLASPDLPPIEVSAGSARDTISEILFTPDSSRIVFVAGGNNGNNNAVLVLDLSNGTETRISRGRYEQGVISPDGTMLGLVNWNLFKDDEAPRYDLTLLDLASAGQGTLFEGGEIVEEELTNPQFAYPLVWRAGQTP